MKIKQIFVAFLLIFIISGLIKTANAVYDPLSVPNNKFGIHILFPTELDKARELVNSSGGDWGYVTIPIQAGDKDIEKWQNFMNEARIYHLIPILRLATEGDYFDKTTWRKPEESDVLDFANFLSSLDWPVKNRYVVIFNEVNRADEWEGQANPAEYANLLSYASLVFKQKSEDYFIISSGFDNAAASANGSYNQYDFIDGMYASDPEVFKKIDGLGSHSYPNPGFSTPPNIKGRRTITSFMHEQKEVEIISGKKLPVFITETGWTLEKHSDKVIGEYFKEAFSEAWSDSSIVSVTPFLLRSGPGPFQQFSFLNDNGEKNQIFTSYASIPKTSGRPELNPAKISVIVKSALLPIRDFSSIKNSNQERLLKNAIKWLFFGF